MPRRVVLIGATGFFGQRLAKRLAALDGIDLVLTSRSEDRARVLAKKLWQAHAKCPVTAIAFECGKATSVDGLRALSPWLVIDASGPFQKTGYDLARAALHLGSHWIDLADAHNYLLGFEAALDAAARKRGLVARAGASSTPCLSHAVVEDLTRNWRRVDTIDIAILPGGAGDVGLSVIQAILSYAGEAIESFQEGNRQSMIGWGHVTRLHVDGLGVRYVSPVETADAALMPQRFGVQSRVTFNAGLESRIEQFGLLLLARLHAAGIAPKLTPLAKVLEQARSLTRLWASDRGGMTVDCAGLDADGHPVSVRWELIAEAGEGPDVPVLPVVALTRKILAGEIASGAGTAAGAVSLGVIEAEMTEFRISTSRKLVPLSDPCLFQKAVGEEAYGRLPNALRAFHDGDAAPVWIGTSDIDGPSSFAGRLLAKLFGFPPGGRAVPVIVSVDRKDGSEIWTRNFGGRRFHSHLRHEGGAIVSERFGPFRILLMLSAVDGVIAMPVVGWRLGPLPLPAFLAPKSDTREFEAGGRFHFDVGISVPLIGRLAHYRGWLEPKGGDVSFEDRPGTSSSSSRHPCPSA